MAEVYGSRGRERKGVEIIGEGRNPKAQKKVEVQEHKPIVQQRKPRGGVHIKRGEYNG